MSKTKSSRAGFGPHCSLRAVPSNHTPSGYYYTATWKGRVAETRDGAIRRFATEDYARAWLAAADVTNGRTAEPV